MTMVPTDVTRVLVVGINYAPESTSTGKYTGEMCEWLAARGHDVRVITAPPYYPQWKIHDNYARKGFHREVLGGVEVIRCPIWVPANPRGLNRVGHLTTFGLSSAAALGLSSSWRPSWIINVAPTLVSAPAVLLASRLSGARCWLHIQDFEFDAATDLGIVRLGPLRAIADATERWLLNRFDVVSTISTQMKAKLAEKGVAADRGVMFPNWVDVDKIVPLNHPSPYRAELNIPADAVVALYSGSMGLKQGLSLLSSTAKRLAIHKEVYFVFAGDGPARSALQDACSNLSNVRFVDLQPTVRLSDWLGLADVHLLPQRADVADLVLPSKLTGMLASGRPILATAQVGTGVADVVTGCGLITPPGDSEAFATALIRLAKNHDQRRRMGYAARKFAESRLARESVLGQFEARLLKTDVGTNER